MNLYTNKTAVNINFLFPYLRFSNTVRVMALAKRRKIYDLAFCNKKNLKN